MPNAKIRGFDATFFVVEGKDPREFRGFSFDLNMKQNFGFGGEVDVSSVYDGGRRSIVTGGGIRDIEVEIRIGTGKEGQQQFERLYNALNQAMSRGSKSPVIVGIDTLLAGRLIVTGVSVNAYTDQLSYEVEGILTDVIMGDVVAGERIINSILAGDSWDTYRKAFKIDEPISEPIKPRSKTTQGFTERTLIASSLPEEEADYKVYAGGRGGGKTSVVWAEALRKVAEGLKVGMLSKDTPLTDVKDLLDQLAIRRAESQSVLFDPYATPETKKLAVEYNDLYDNMIEKLRQMVGNNSNSYLSDLLNSLTTREKVQMLQGEPPDAYKGKVFTISEVIKIMRETNTPRNLIERMVWGIIGRGGSIMVQVSGGEEVLVRSWGERRDIRPDVEVVLKAINNQLDREDKQIRKTNMRRALGYGNPYPDSVPDPENEALTYDPNGIAGTLIAEGEIIPEVMKVVFGPKPPIRPKDMGTEITITEVQEDNRDVDSKRSI